MRKTHFLWKYPAGVTNWDGPTMLQILVHSVNLTTCVGVSNYRLVIQNSNLSDRAENVKVVLYKMEVNYQKIIKQKHTHGNYIM